MSYVKVFSKNNCMQCRMVKNWLSDHDIEFTEVKIDEYPSVARELELMGFQTVPVTYIDTDTFNGYVKGFAVNKLKEYLGGK